MNYYWITFHDNLSYTFRAKNVYDIVQYFNSMSCNRFEETIYVGSPYKITKFDATENDIKYMEFLEKQRFEFE